MVEELDLIHKSNYYQELISLYNFSHSQSSFFGQISSGSLAVSEQDFSRSDIRKLDGPGEIQSRDGAVYYWLPRVAPHFFGFCGELYDQFTELDAGFQSGISRHAEWLLSEKGFDCDFFSDSGSDLFRELISYENFYHMSEIEFIFHVKSLSLCYLKMIDEEHDSEFYYSILNQKFDEVKKHFSYLPFHESCIFAENEFDQKIN